MDYTKDINFWKRLKAYVEKVDDGHPMDQEEKEMIIHNCDLKMIPEKSTISKSVILKELEEQIHPEKVEDVIFWALKFYSETYPVPNSFGRIIASSIVSNIEETELKERTKSN